MRAARRVPSSRSRGTPTGALPQVGSGHARNDSRRRTTAHTAFPSRVLGFARPRARRRTVLGYHASHRRQSAVSTGVTVASAAQNLDLLHLTQVRGGGPIGEVHRRRVIRVARAQVEHAGGVGVGVELVQFETGVQVRRVVLSAAGPRPAPRRVGPWFHTSCTARRRAGWARKRPGASCPGPGAASAPRRSRRTRPCPAEGGTAGIPAVGATPASRTAAPRPAPAAWSSCPLLPRGPPYGRGSGQQPAPASRPSTPWPTTWFARTPATTLAATARPVGCRALAIR